MDPKKDFLSSLLQGITGGIDRVAAAGMPADTPSFTKGISDYFTKLSQPQQPVVTPTPPPSQEPQTNFLQGISNFFTQPKQETQTTPQVPQVTPTPQYEMTTFQDKPALQENKPGVTTTTSLDNPQARDIAMKQGFITPTPQPPSPTASPVSTDTTLGRTSKFQEAKKGNEAGYQQLSSALDSFGASPLEKQLALDVASQESNLGQVDKNYNWPKSTSRGPFMFNNGTWKDYLKANPDAAARGADQSNPNDATEAFLFAIRNGIGGQGLHRWDASKPVWGQGYTPEELSAFKK